MSLFSLRGLAILTLFVFPTVFVLLEAGLEELNLYFSAGVLNGTIDRQFVIQFEYSILRPVNYFEISALIIILIVYPLIPIVYSSERYFQERGYVNTVIENERLNKIIYFLLPFFVLGILNILRAEHILTISPGGIESMLLPQIFQQGMYSLTLFRIVTFVATLVFASALLKTTTKQVVR